MMTIRDGVSDRMMANGETWNDVETKTISDWEMDTEFENSYGSKSCNAFMIWTKKHVYFPVCYDGCILFYSVPRNPTIQRGTLPMMGRW